MHRGIHARKWACVCARPQLRYYQFAVFIKHSENTVYPCASVVQPDNRRGLFKFDLRSTEVFTRHEIGHVPQIRSRNVCSIFLLISLCACKCFLFAPWTVLTCRVFYFHVIAQCFVKIIDPPLTSQKNWSSLMLYSIKDQEK